MSLFQLHVSSTLPKTFFSMHKKGASCVALFCAEKIGFWPSWLSTYIWGLALALLTTLFDIQTINAQSNPQKPKIGLVLSGGGAKGFAHIGVLKVIDSLGIKIDFVGGTSMGSVVGGLYASGYTGIQIDSIFRATNFGDLIKDYIPRSSKNFYEKKNDETYTIALPFSKFKIGVPLSLSKGMYNFNLLNKLTHKVRNITDFNKLPIPFLCMATNIESGKSVLINSGSLAQALLASSAFPTLFSPVEINGQMLMDGGLTNNYPLEEIRNLGATIIIGVDVQDALRDRNSLKEATKIMVQISNLQMIEKMKTKIPKTDLYIKPDISKYNIVSFDQGLEIINEGKKAALNNLESLKKLAQNTPNYKHQSQQQKPGLLHIDQVIINELEHYTRAYIVGKLGFNDHQTLCYDDLTIGIDKLNATQNFSAITYTLNPQPDNTNDIVLQLSENAINSYIKFGMHYDGLFKSALLANFTHKKSLSKNDVLSLDVILGDNFRYNLDYYIDNGFYWSFGIKSKFQEFSKNATTDFSNGQLLSKFNSNSLPITYADWTNQMYVQTVFVQKFAMIFGVEHKKFKIKSENFQNNTQIIEDNNYFSVFSNLKFDSFDHKYFPKTGVYLAADFQSYLASSYDNSTFKPFSIAKAEVAFAKTWFKNTTLKWQVETGFSVGNTAIPTFNFVFGGFGFNEIDNIKPLFGYDFLSVSNNSFVKTTATFDFEFYKNNHFNIAGNLAKIEDNLFKTTRSISIPNYTGYAVGYGLETVFGPIEIKHSWSPEIGKNYTWFSVGFWF